MSEVDINQPSPMFRVLSLGAGVQSTALALLSIDGHLPKLDHAIFADTGWEPQSVYTHLDRLEVELSYHGIELHRVSAGNIALDALDALDPEHRFASMPLYTQEKPQPCTKCKRTGELVVTLDDESTKVVRCARCRGTGTWDGKGMVRRQCTSEYKLKPIKEKVRELLGAPRVNGKATRVKRGRFVESWVGISTDEFERIAPHGVSYMRRVDPLVETLKLSRDQCEAYLADRWRWPVGKSACIGCPFHSNAEWRALRDNEPDAWEAALVFDNAIRDENRHLHMPHLRGVPFLHDDRVPLREVDIDRETDNERRARLQPQLFTLRACNPFDCRSAEYDTVPS